MNFFARNKRIFVIMIFLGITFLIGYLLWSVFFKPEPQTPIIDEELVTGGQLPISGSSTPTETIFEGVDNFFNDPQTNIPNPNDPSKTANGGLTETNKAVDSSVSNPTSSGNNVQYYNENDGKFYRLDENGKAVLLSDKVFHDVDNVVWSPTKNKAIIEYPDGSNILYDFSTKKQVTLPSHWEDFSFSPDGSQLVSKSIALDPENRWLIISNDDGSQAKAIEKIGTNDNIVYPDWSPNQQIIATYTKGLDFNRQEVFFVGQNNENFKSTVIEGRGLESSWSSEGDKLLYSVYNTSDGLNPRLWIVNASTDSIGENRSNLNLMTWASKCTFASNSEIYCAVPESLPEGSGLFPELADKTKDILYKIDLETGTKKLIAIPDGAYNVSNIVVPENQDYIYFTDKKTNELYKIDL